jgi:hypothetical protein
VTLNAKSDARLIGTSAGGEQARLIRTGTGHFSPGGRISVTQIVEKDQSPARPRLLGLRVPPNLFAIALGIAGLAEAWHAAVPLLGTPQAVPDALSILGAPLWLVLVGAYLAQGPRIILADLRDPVLSPFVSASAITAMILSAALAKEAAPAAGRVLVVVFLAVTLAIGGWLTGQWMTGGIEPDSVHPGYFLPTAAGGLIGADAAAQVHLHALAEASLGIGIISCADQRRRRAVGGHDRGQPLRAAAG